MRIAVMIKRTLQKLFCRENLFALLLCVILILVIVVTADASPRWIYQGF
jgi:hypothetical protein